MTAMSPMQQYAQSLLAQQQPQPDPAQGQMPPGPQVPQNAPPSPYAPPPVPQMPQLPVQPPAQPVPQVPDRAGQIQQVLASDPTPTGPHGERLNLNRANDVMEYSRQGNEDSAREFNLAQEHKLQSQRDLLKAQSDQAQALAPLQQDLLDKQQQQMQYQSMLDQKIVSLKTAAAADYQSRSEYYQQKAAENPADVWGNWNNAQRVTGVIGMVAAGLGKQSATGYIQNFADQAVAQQQREVSLMGASFKERDNMYAQYLDAYGDQKTASNAMYATYYSLAAQQMKQTAARYDNPIAQANLNATAADLLQKSAEHQEKLQQNVAENGWKRIDAGLKQQELDMRRQEMEQKKKEQEGLMGDDFTNAIPKEGAEKVQTVVAGSRNITRDLEEMRYLAAQKPSENTYYRMKALQAQVFGAMRQISESGARIEDSEKANIFDPQTITLNDYLKGKAGFEDVDDKINAVQENVSRAAVDRVAAVSRDNSLRQESPLYEPYQRALEREGDHRTERQERDVRTQAQRLLDETEERNGRGERRAKESEDNADTYRGRTASAAFGIGP